MEIRLESRHREDVVVVVPDREIFAVSNIHVDLQAAGPNEFPTKVPRPKYSVLENRSLKRLGLNRFSSWRDALYEYLGQSCAVAS
jgi:dTDP-4-dehydrorhamnose reductase